MWLTYPHQLGLLVTALAIFLALKKKKKKEILYSRLVSLDLTSGLSPLTGTPATCSHITSHLIPANNTSPPCVSHPFLLSSWTDSAGPKAPFVERGLAQTVDLLTCMLTVRAV